MLMLISLVISMANRIRMSSSSSLRRNRNQVRTREISPRTALVNYKYGRRRHRSPRDTVPSAPSGSAAVPLKPRKPRHQEPKCCLNLPTEPRHRSRRLRSPPLDLAAIWLARPWGWDAGIVIAGKLRAWLNNEAEAQVRVLLLRTVRGFWENWNCSISVPDSTSNWLTRKLCNHIFVTLSYVA